MLIKCKKCGELRPHEAKRLCGNCYQKQLKPKIITCKKCGNTKEHVAKGLCNSCYRKQAEHKIITCKECGEEKPHAAKGLCTNCYNNQLNHKTGKSQPMHLNKSCAQYLGVHIAEKVLSKVFKDVQKMPYGNKGYDFICNKGMKIDVKSSTLHFDKRSQNHKGQWYFKIKKNTIPDYFLCIAFNDRSSLTPQHLWLIPSEKISHLIGLGISKNQILKYSKYELPLEKTLECCNKMKQ